MSGDLFLSRARLRRDASVAPVANLLLPKDQDQRVTNAHKLLWTLFADSGERKRDFLWREAQLGTFYLLSARQPEDRHALFDLDPAKPFAPALSPGDRLAFSLRANPTVSYKSGAAARGGRGDVVMHALKSVPPDERAARRGELVDSAGRAWLERQGAKHGFALETLRVEGYRLLQPPHRGSSMRIATLDFDGRLRVTDPDAFLQAVARGFGRAKAYGCGLMLIRRA